MIHSKSRFFVLFQVMKIPVVNLKQLSSVDYSLLCQMDKTRDSMKTASEQRLTTLNNATSGWKKTEGHAKY